MLKNIKLVQRLRFFRLSALFYFTTIHLRERPVKSATIHLREGQPPISETGHWRILSIMYMYVVVDWERSVHSKLLHRKLELSRGSSLLQVQGVSHSLSDQYILAITADRARIREHPVDKQNRKELTRRRI